MTGPVAAAEPHGRAEADHIGWSEAGPRKRETEAETGSGDSAQAVADGGSEPGERTVLLPDVIAGRSSEAEPMRPVAASRRGEPEFSPEPDVDPAVAPAAVMVERGPAAEGNEPTRVADVADGADAGPISQDPEVGRAKASPARAAGGEAGVAETKVVPTKVVPPDLAGDAGELGVDGPHNGSARNVLLTPGAVVGEISDCRWEVLRHIADGGFSSVYRVRPASFETTSRFGPAHRALKCLWGTPAELTQLGGEAGKMAAVDGHDNVLGLVASLLFEQATAFSRSHYVGLVLELAGEDLYQFGTRVTVPERAWAAIFEQLAAGLEHIHARRIVHGDIKPTNLLRVGPSFKIADFGLSAQLETTRSAGIGLARTIAFWPPETSGQGVLGADGVRRPPVEGWRASQMGDVWALAVSMHRILAGRHITNGVTPEQQYELVCAGRYTVDDRLSSGWRRLLADCLVHDPDQRIVTTAADLRRRLAELALPEGYLSVPWSDGEPRTAALLDGIADDQTLLLYQTQEGGRIHGVFVPRGEVLLDVVRHIHSAVVPSLAQQVRDSQHAAVSLAEEQERIREQAARLAAADDAAGTQIIRESELEHTRQLSVAVAEVTRQRDQAARDRDQAIRRGDSLMAERDRLARLYGDLSRRLDRLEGAGAARASSAPTPRVIHVPVAQPVHRPRRRNSATGCLFWGFLVLLLGLAVGVMAASQVLYEDPWKIISSAVDAFSDRLRGN